MAAGGMHSVRTADMSRPLALAFWDAAAALSLAALARLAFPRFAPTCTCGAVCAVYMYRPSCQKAVWGQAGSSPPFFTTAMAVGLEPSGRQGTSLRATAAWIGALDAWEGTQKS